MPISATIPNLPTGSSIDVRVRAFNQAGFGPYSLTQTLSTTSPAPTPTPTGVTRSFVAPVEWRATVVPGQVTGVTATSPTNTTMTVGWQTPAGPPPASGYIVQFKRAVDPTYTLAPSWLESINGVTIAPGSGSIVDGALSPNTFTISGGGQVMINGTPDGVTSGVDGGKYWAHQFWQHTSLGWWGYLGTPGSYTANQADPALSIPASTSFSQVITVPATGTLYNIRVLAFNAVGNGPVSSVVNQTTTSGSTGLAPPAQVAAAGFNTLVFFSGFDSPSEITTDRSGATATKWYINGSGLNYTVANSVLSLNNSISSFNADISTVANSGAALTTPGAIRAGNGSGLRFKYGGFEALMKVDINNISGNGWVAWWANGFQHNVLSDFSQNSIELDFLEIFQPNPPGSALGETSTGLWNWASNPQTTVPTFATLGWGDQTYLTDQATGNNALGQCADWIIVGGIVTPTQVEVYFNSKARRAQGIADTTIFRVNTTQVYSTNVGNAVFDASRLCDMQLLLGGSSGSPFQIDYVAAWQ